MAENGNGKGVNVVLETMTNALTDQMVERLTQNIEKIVELGDKLSDPQMMETIDKLTKNAEALNKSVENLIEATTALSTMLNAFTDSMVERLTSTISELGELVDEVNRSNMKEILPHLKTLTAGNNMEALMDAANAVAVMRNALSDSMVERIVSLITDITVNLAKFRVEEIGTAALSSIEKASREIEQQPEKVGLGGLLKAIRDPEIQKGLIFALYLIRDLSQTLPKK
ncbi:DUF1641 domain-containing protein [Persephonella atlantica]|uniref:DUF1641 domain-containing protein n=1 Tax=Persephonella atlantica TaxID=2699429 RepID=A0ABS1GK93_9AQUI|nr:DUF1641 domain-containing protein [Persephonella atlantica]MBK3333246.1 DUF1641 domain-containing protein [Persephonella atlantica]